MVIYNREERMCELRTYLDEIRSLSSCMIVSAWLERSDGLRSDSWAMAAIARMLSRGDERRCKRREHRRGQVRRGEKRERGDVRAEE